MTAGPGLGFHGFKAGLRCSACRTDPVVGQVLEFGARRDVAVRITYRGVVDITTDLAYVFHSALLSRAGNFLLRQPMICLDPAFVNRVENPYSSIDLCLTPYTDVWLVCVSLFEYVEAYKGLPPEGGRCGAERS